MISKGNASEGKGWHATVVRTTRTVVAEPARAPILSTRIASPGFIRPAAARTIISRVKSTAAMEGGDGWFWVARRQMLRQVAESRTTSLAESAKATPLS